MDIPVQTPRIQTTFIPKQPLTASPLRRSPIGFLTLIAVIVFLASASGWGGSFIWRAALDRQVRSLEGSLERVKEAFEPATLNLFIDLDRKFAAAANLLSGHTSLLPLFDHLEELTIRTVRFKDFKFQTLPEGGQLIMNGLAPDYQTVALQADEFGRSNLLVNPIFYDLDLDQVGNVVFTVQFNLAPSLLSYSNNL